MSIHFSCPGCGRELETEDHTAGAEAACPDCGQEFSIPEAAEDPSPAGAEPVLLPEAAEDPSPAGAVQVCPRCGQGTANPNARICLGCGASFSGGDPYRRKADGVPWGRVLLCLALIPVFAALWAFITYQLGMTHNYIAIGFGIVFGLVVRGLIPERSPRVGILAAAMALVAYFLGTLLMVSYPTGLQRDQVARCSVVPAFTGGIHPERLSLDCLASSILYWQYSNGERPNPMGEEERLPYKEILRRSRLYEDDIQEVRRELERWPEAELDQLRQNEVDEYLIFAHAEEMVDSGSLSGDDPDAWELAERSFRLLNPSERQRLAAQVLEGQLAFEEQFTLKNLYMDQLEFLDFLFAFIVVICAFSLAGREELGRSQ